MTSAIIPQIAIFPHLYSVLFTLIVTDISPFTGTFRIPSSSFVSAAMVAIDSAVRVDGIGLFPFAIFIAKICASSKLEGATPLSMRSFPSFVSAAHHLFSSKTSTSGTQLSPFVVTSTLLLPCISVAGIAAIRSAHLFCAVSIFSGVRL